MPAIRPIEFFLIELIFYLGLWLWNEYIASMLSSVFMVIFLVIFIVSIIVEKIEPSKVPRSYFYFMFLSVLAPMIAAIIFVSIMGGKIDWLMG